MNVPIFHVLRRPRRGRAGVLAFVLVVALPFVPVSGAARGGERGSSMGDPPPLPGLGAPSVFVPVDAPLPPAREGLAPETFRLKPTTADTTYRLLVVPVRFPEDAILGGGGRSGLEAALLDTTSLSLRAYYRAATGSRLTVESTLAPIVVAEHSRTYYTVEGAGNLGYGLDPDAYPHNARRLVEEVTGKLELAVDFRRYDNTGDGIVDGLLLLNSGPVSGEAVSEPLPPEVLAAHSFTLEDPVERGGVLVFPYAVAATRDGVGVWAHEVGHLLGLTDLYVANGLCPGPGVGEWSLMATGANRASGSDPSGLDAFSRQLLGMRPRAAEGGTVALAEGEFLRVFRPGREDGPTYFLVERRTGADGLGLPVPAWVVYLVDEDAGDNRSCPLPPELHRPLVEVRAVVCPGAPCTTLLDDATDPGLRDRDDAPTGLILAFSGDSVLVRRRDLPAARLERVGLGAPRDEGDRVQYLRLTVRNLDPVAATGAALKLAAGRGMCLRDSTRMLLLAPGEAMTESLAVILDPCPGRLPGPGPDTVVVTLLSADSVQSRSDTVAVPLDKVGLEGAVDARYATTNLAPGRVNPWVFADSTWEVADLAPFADGELESPWFSVPEDGRLVLDHAWNLTALSPDVALDGVQVRLRRPLHPDVLLSPVLGWGYTALRKSGNALAGREVLSGAGTRRHVLSLADYAGDVVRVVLRAAGDVEADGGTWIPEALRVARAPGITFRLVQDPADPYRLSAVTAASGTTGATLTLYAGPGVTTPVLDERTVEWEGRPETLLGDADPDARRFTLIWSTAGAASAFEAVLRLPAPPSPRGFLGLPYPNPVRRGSRQAWPIHAGDEDPTGEYTCILSDAAGRKVVHRRFRLDVAGIRPVPWDGRGDDGREVPAGMYFLQVRRPDGTTNARKIVVLP